MPDNVNSPTHYNQGEIECIDAIKAALTPEEFRGFLKGNAIKYIWREKHKNGVEDCKKADWYLERLVKEENVQGRSYCQDAQPATGSLRRTSSRLH